ncbi:MAG: carboxy terminal-processing peptidase [Thermodesulfobacteriota bacterium]|nr:carboxy terminal-processing peptidase [Thermodesulfobacteriota bacterium]
MDRKLFFAGALGFITLLIIAISLTTADIKTTRSPETEQERPLSFDPAEKLAPESKDKSICISIIKSLENYHYSEKKLDDFLSSEILDHYLDILDPSKHLFTQKDIKKTEKIKYILDDTLKTGNLAPGFDLFNLYLKRSFQRFVWLIDHVSNWEEEFDFTRDESLLVNHEDLPWPAQEQDLFRVWRRELKNTLLSYRLEGELSHEEITTTLKRRYSSRLNRLSQTNAKDVFRTYINAVTTSFDPHTQYFPPRASEDFDILMSLSLEGIGAVLQSDFEYTKVVRLIPAGPAEKAEVLTPGDKIIGVGQTLKGKIQDVTGWRIDEVVRLIRGPKDTFVRLSIIPADKKGLHNSKTVSIKRDKVKLEEQAAQKSLVTVPGKDKPYKIGIIEIPAFYLDFHAMQAGEKNYKSTTNDVRALIDELEDENIDGLIVDVRNNGGGSLQEVNLLAGLFIKSGPVVQIRDRSGYISRLKDPDPRIVYSGPLVVMINRMSASASEIFAGAVKDYNRGIVVGSRTFGKGTVQGLQPISNGQLKITSAKFYRVSGESTQNYGVEPHIEYPHVYNSKETGESSLKGALPWDRTTPAFFKPYRKLDPIVTELQKNHDQRKKNNPDFVYLQKKFALTHELYTIKSWSLNEDKRKQQKDQHEQKELAIENKRLKKRHLDEIHTIEELENQKKERETPDFLLDETTLIMGDFIKLAESKGFSW